MADPFGGYEPFDAFDAGVASVLAYGTNSAARRRADRDFSEAALVRAALRVVSGGMPGLSGRWLLGLATVSPGCLEFRRRWSRVLVKPAVMVMVSAVYGPPRIPGSREIMKLPGPVLQIESDTGVLEWAVHSRYRSAALDLLQVPYHLPADQDP